MEQIDLINKRLIEYWGYGEGKDPNFRVVFSDDQFENFWGTRAKFDSHKNLLGTETGFHQRKKYAFIRGKWILEQLMPVPEVNKTALLDKKLSYECIWTFMDSKGNPLPVKWEAIEIVINTILKARNKAFFAKYTDHEDEPIQKAARIAEIEDELFGNESNVSDSLAHGQAIIVPNSYEKVN
jgi:hypothetical protein